MTASTRQEGGTHYADLPEHVQPWNVLAHWLTPEEYRGWQKGNAIVYLARERQKGGDTDIRKASHHLERLIEEFAPPVEKWNATSPEITPLPVHETPEPTDPRMQANPWIEWKGGTCPVPKNSDVEVWLEGAAARLRCTYAGFLDWSDRAERKITAYRLHKPSQPSQPAEPEKAAEPQQWPYYSAGPDHSKAKELWGDGKGMEHRLGPVGAGLVTDWYPDSPDWDARICYEIRPQGAQA